MMFEPTKRDLEDIKYDLRDVSIFFREPLSVYIPGYPEFKVGMGFGGYHWSLFQRGADCNACGNCCKRTFRRIWFWWESERERPRGLQPLDMRLNGKWTRIWVHVNSSYDRCDYLQTQEEYLQFEFRGDSYLQPKEYCDLHTSNLHDFRNVKPVHCRLHPLTGLYKHKDRLLFSRRLPSRNFRWPMCPIPIADVPYTMGDYIEDKVCLERLTLAVDTVPGSFSWSAFELWEDVMHFLYEGTEKPGTVLFEENLMKKEQQIWERNFL